MLHSGVCTYKTSVKESRTAVREEKISLNDDRAKQVFTVSIMHVTERDSGEYWCGVEAGESEDGYKVYIMRIDMTFTDPNVRVSQRPSSLSSSSTSTHRIPTNSSKSSTSHPVPTSLLTGSPVFITVSVILAVLLVLLIAFLTGIFWRRMDPILSVPRTIHEVPSADIRRLSNTLYSTDHLPTIPADSSHAVYANIGLPTIPTDAVYATTQLPSDGPDQYVCSTT
ncbi:CMRF35-like molecule 6 [Ictalurus furcatus]|uniref:CMRF35-like molecule 6 n=1 Tax=Ictalurus furcatus TaxID=66913 RepID=UPI0023509057|nr:CMRF35-like molecule 6 [Ictalurus furcatus]